MTTMAAGIYRCESIGSSTMSNDISSFNITNNLTAELDSTLAEPIQVYLRIRSPTSDEITNQMATFNYDIQEQKHLILQPTQLVKSKMSQCCHRFSFTKIFDRSANQEEIFNCTAKDIVQEFCEGNNRLIFNYGVTNAGKTFTMQGKNNEPGIIPRSLDYVFQRYGSQISSFPKYKPHDGTIVKLSWAETMKESKIKNECLKMDLSSSVSLGSTFNISKMVKSNGSISTDDDSGHSTIFSEKTQLSNDSAGSYSIWISFVEIYNEQIFDLLGSIGSKTRKTLKLRESENGSSFLQGITEIFVNSPEEAYKILRNGRQVLRQAATKLNHFSSRSHCIFTVKLIRYCDSELATSLNQLSFCDLAGSERTSKTHNVGERLRETGVINTSLMVLGRCIHFLRQNQNLIRENPLIVPFRDSKITMMFKAFLIGHGKTSMLINISPCANMFDETLHVLKFSAVAKELSLPIYPVSKVTRKSLNNLRVSLLGDRTSIAWQTSMCETEMGEDSETEGDLKLENALEVIELLNQQVAKLENEKLQLELDLREELCTEFAAQLKDTQDYYRDRLNEEEEQYEQMASKRINNLEDYYLNKKCEECEARRHSTKLCDSSAQYEILPETVNMEVEEEKNTEQSNHINSEATNQSFVEKIANLEKELIESNAERLSIENQLKTNLSYVEKIATLEKELMEANAKLNATSEANDKPIVILRDVAIEVDLKECSTNTTETQTSLLEEPNSLTKIESDAETQTSLIEEPASETKIESDAEFQTSFIEEPDNETKSESDAKNLSLRKSLYYSLSSSSVSGDELFKHPLSPTTSKNHDVAVSKIPEEVAKSLITVGNMQNQINDIHGIVEELVKQAAAKTSLISESENLTSVSGLPKEDEKDSLNEKIKDLLSEIKIDTHSIKESFRSKDEEKVTAEKIVPDQCDNNEIIINATAEMKDILSQIRAQVLRLEEIKLPVTGVKLTQSSSASSVAETCIVEPDETIELPALKTSQLNENSRECKTATAGCRSSRKRLNSTVSSKDVATNEEAEDELPGVSSQQSNMSSYITPMKTTKKVADGLRQTKTRQKGIKSSKKEKLETFNASDSSSEDDVPVLEDRTTKKRKGTNQKKSKKLKLDDDSFELPPKPLKQLRRYDKMAVTISPTAAAAPETKPNVHTKVLRNLRQRK